MGGVAHRLHQVLHTHGEHVYHVGPALEGVGEGIALPGGAGRRQQREPAAGEAHTATAVGSVVEIEADGVTGTWEYTNSDISGNPIALSLVLDGAEIYSAKLQPGESLDGITLNAPVAAGTYQAMAVTTVADADGEDQLTTRVPVTLHVAG